MSRMFEQPYSEVKERPFARRLWAVVNATIFKVVTNRMRMRLLRCFGAKLDGYLVVNPTVRIYAPWHLYVAKPWAVLAPGVEVYNKADVKLGAHTIVSQGAYLCTASHDVSSPVMALITKPIVLEDDTWVAAKAVVLPGVTMHEGSVAGCAAVVSKDVEAWTVVCGNPAKITGKRVLSPDTSATTK